MAKKRVTTNIAYYGPRENPFRAIRKELIHRGLPKAREVLLDEAEILAEDVQMYIFEQGGAQSWPALNEDYLRYKIRNEHDERMLIAYGDYVAEIKARKKSGGSKVEVGLPDENHPGSGLPYKELGRILEYGHKGFKRVGEGLIPPRPHWRPVWQRWIKKVRRVNRSIQKEVSETVFKKAAQKMGKKKVKV